MKDMQKSVKKAIEIVLPLIISAYDTSNPYKHHENNEKLKSMLTKEFYDTLIQFYVDLKERDMIIKGKNHEVNVMAIGSLQVQCHDDTFDTLIGCVFQIYESLWIEKDGNIVLGSKECSMKMAHCYFERKNGKNGQWKLAWFVGSNY